MIRVHPEIDPPGPRIVRTQLPGVLAYHKVGTPEFGGTWCTAGQLRRHLAALRTAGWEVLDAARYEHALEPSPSVARERELEQSSSGVREERTHQQSSSGLREEGAVSGTPAARGHGSRRVLLTFDDAFESFATHAWPELQNASVPVLLFVIGDFVGCRSTWDLALAGRRVRHLDWPALRDLVRAGVSIGSHAATHRDLRRLDDRTLEGELQGSRLQLEDRLGIEVRSISYPFGSADGRVREAARSAGYRLGFAMGPGSRHAPFDRFALPRHGVYIIDGASAVLDKLDPARGGHAWQQLAGRAIHACAALSARGSVKHP